MGYKGDVSAEKCFEILRSNHSAQLIDVRTKAEWSFIGIPDLSSLSKNVHLIEWLMFPTQAINEHFTTMVKEAIENQGLDDTADLFFLCRSGARSQSAAAAMTACGFANCYNVEAGFEGNLDQNRHRGKIDGWKADNLPWVQQ